MINSKNLLFFLQKSGIKNFFGVPDSNLKYFINLLDDKKRNHFICANEGLAVSMGIGYYLATKKTPAIYMQNSGLSNALNPILSIAHSKVYSIPLFLIIGWRGSPGSKDEPQHLVKGKITPSLLKLAGVKTEVIKSDSDFKKIYKLVNYAKRKKCPVAILIKNNSLSKTKNKLRKLVKREKLDITREVVIKELCKQIDKKTYIVSNTGFASRELDKFIRESKNKKIIPFYMIGGMGHTSMVAVSKAIYGKKNNVICIDGDGSLIMHFGSLINTGLLKPSNFKHLLINNYQHESVGGQTTNVDQVNFTEFAKNSGYLNILNCKKKINLESKLKSFLKAKEISFMEIKTLPSNSKNLGRPNSFLKIKNNFFK